MSYDDLERSKYDGNPIQFYEFLIGGKKWAYVASDTPITYAGVYYETLAISDSGIVISGDAAQDALTITAPSTIGIADLYRGTPPAEDLWVRVKRLDWGSADMVTVYVGTVSEVNQPTPGSLEILCSTLDVKLRGSGLRLTYQRSCPYILYDSNCRADKNQFGYNVTINTATGGKVNSPEIGLMPDGWFAAGYLEFTKNDILHRRGIEQHVGNDITLLGFSDGLEAGMRVALYAGCDHSYSTCEGKFNNIINYGGVFFMPGKSPFDGDPVF